MDDLHVPSQLTRPFLLKRPAYVPGASFFKNVSTCSFWYAGRSNLTCASTREENCSFWDMSGAAHCGDAGKASVSCPRDRERQDVQWATCREGRYEFGLVATVIGEALLRRWVRIAISNAPIPGAEGQRNTSCTWGVLCSLQVMDAALMLTELGEALADSFGEADGY